VTGRTGGTSPGYENFVGTEKVIGASHHLLPRVSSICIFLALFPFVLESVMPRPNRVEQFVSSEICIVHAV
jgi:hypothetical protein